LQPATERPLAAPEDSGEGGGYFSSPAAELLCSLWKSSASVEDVVLTLLPHPPPSEIGALHLCGGCSAGPLARIARSGPGRAGRSDQLEGSLPCLQEQLNLHMRNCRGHENGARKLCCGRLGYQVTL
jgi:hypothetical protein